MTDRIALHQFRNAAAVSEREHAFADIVRRHAAWLYNAALRQVNDPAAAEEATQATFIVLARKAGKLRDDTSLTSWLAAVLRLAVLRVKRDHARRRKHETQAAMNQAKDSAADPSTAQDPAAAAEWRELAPLLDDAVANLSHTDREAILLRFYRQLTYVEIGDALHLNEDAARKRVDRAVEKLRGTLNRRGVLSGVGAAALATLLWTNSTAIAAPPGLIGVSSSLALSTSATATAAQATATAKGVSIMLVTTKLKLIAAALFLLLVVGVAGEAIVRRSAPRLVSTTSTAVENALFGPPAVQPVSAPLIGRMKNGVTIELVGVSAQPDDTNKTKQPLWWRPSGEVSPESYLRGMALQIGSDPGKTRLEFQFALHTPSGVGLMDWNAAIEGATKVGYGLASNAATPSEAQFKVAAYVPDRPVTLRFNTVAWTTVLAGHFPFDTPGELPAPTEVIDEKYKADFKSEVSFSRPRDADNADGVETQMYAIDAEGIIDKTSLNLHFASSFSRSADASTPGNDWFTYRFADLAPKQIRELYFRTRPRDQWVEFRNIAVHGGQATKPIVATSDDTARATFADGVTTELLAIGDAAADEWWTPDGRPTQRPAGIDNPPMPPGPAVPGTRLLSFFTVTRGKDRPVEARDMPSLPRNGVFSLQTQRPDGLELTTLQMFRIKDDVATLTWRTQVVTANTSQTTVLSPRDPAGWTPADATSLTSPGGTTYTLSSLPPRDGQLVFAMQPFVDKEAPDDLAVTLLGRNGEQVPGVYRTTGEDASHLREEVSPKKGVMSEIGGVRLTLRRFEHQVDFTNVALRPGMSTDVKAVVTEMPPAAK